MPTKKLTSKTKKKRAYNNTSRREKTETSSREIIETLIELLVTSQGADVPFKDISAKSKIPMRTIFRLFKDKQALHEATDQYLTQIISTSMNELSKLDFLSFAKNTFAAYDRNQGLVIAYLFSPFGRQARTILRQRFNRLLLDQILKERKIEVDEMSTAKLSFIVSLVNAKLWYDLKTDFGFSGDKSGTIVEWALNVLLNDLEGSQKVARPVS